MIKTTCDIPLVKLANKNLKPQKYLKKADSAPNLSKIEDGGVEVKVVTPIFYARILLIFVPSTFVESLKKNMCQFPKVAIPLKKLKKENLVKVVAHSGITPAVGATKSHILDLIKDHCIENDIIDEVQEKPTAETAEVLKLRLEIEREERRLAREEAQRARDAEKALQDAQFVEAQKAREAARELKLAELKEARELRELELKAEQEKALLAAEIEAKKEAAAREHELKMASLGKQSPSDKASAFDPARNIRLVPPFQEKEVDKYFAHFEKVADSLIWPKESWVLLLQSVLVGKAQEIYGSLS